MSRQCSLSKTTARMIVFSFALAGFLSIRALAQSKPESKNMELVGYNDLQGRSAYQPTIHKQGNRWIAYIGHHGGTAMNSLTGQDGRQRHVHRGRDRSEESEISRAHSRRSAHSRGRANPAARRWRACATAANCRAPARTNSICCARAALPPMKCGTSPIPRSRAA